MCVLRPFSWNTTSNDRLCIQNFTSVRQDFAERFKKLKEAAKAGPTTPSASSVDPKMQSRKPKNMFPIIIISSSPTALVTMYNVKKFLMEAMFVFSPILVNDVLSH